MYIYKGMNPISFPSDYWKIGGHTGLSNLRKNILIQTSQKVQFVRDTIPN